MKQIRLLKYLKICLSALLVFILLHPSPDRAYADTTLYNVQANIGNSSDYTVVHKIDDKDAGYGADNLHFYLNSYVYPAEANPITNYGYNTYLTLIGDQYTDGISHSDSVTKSITYFLSSKAELAWGRQEYDLDIKKYPLPEGVTTLDKVEVRFKSSHYAFSNTKSSNRLVITAMPAPDTEKPTTPMIYRSSDAVWSNKDVTASIGGSTDNVGIKGYWYRINSTSSSDWKVYTAPLVFSTEGEYKLDAWVYDTSKNYSASYRFTTIRIDKTPSSAPTITGDDSSYKNVDEVSLTLTDGIDTLSGIDHTEYYFSGATTSGWQAGNTARVNAEGVTVVHARTIDTAGNISTETTQTVRIDRTVPNITVSEQKIDNMTIRLTATATDDSSGIQSITLPDGQVVHGTTATYDAKVNGEYTFSALDNVNLSSTATKTLTHLDGEPPTINITYDNHFAQKVMVHISARDTNTGIEHITLPNGQVVINDVATYEVTENGEYTFTATDKAGNIATHTITISTIDHNIPLLIVDYDESPHSSLTFQIHASDSDSGISFITLPDGTKVESDHAEYTISQNGTYTFSVTDQANNITEEIVTITTIDTISPELQINYDTSYQQNLNVDILAIDQESGIEYITLPDGVIVRKDQARFVISENGIYTFEALDKAGNTITKVITIENIDKKSPTIQLSSDSATWSSDIKPIIISYQDDESGLNVNKMYYKVTHSASIPTSWDVAESHTQTVRIDQEGEWYIHSQATDLAGNQTQVSSQKYQYQKQPEIPSLQVTGIASDQLKLEWATSASAAITGGYTYIVRNITTGKTFQLSYPIHSFIDDQLEGGKNYQYTIQSQNYVGISEPSEAVSAYTLPNMPSSASITSSGRDYNTALVSIEPVESAISYQIIARNMNTGVIDGQRTVMQNTYQSISDLLPYTPYDISIIVTNHSGSSKPYHLSYLSLPDKVDGFNSVQMMENAILLSWNTVSQATYSWSSVKEDTYYSLERENTNIYLGNSTFFKDQYLLSGTPYNYAIAAGNHTGFGHYVYLNEIWTLPSIVARLEQIDADTNTVTLSWQESRGALGYQLNVEGIGEFDLKRNITQSTIKGLEAGSTYRAFLTPYNKSGYGTAKEILITTLPDRITSESVEIKEIQETTATFVIHAIKGAKTYRLNINQKEYIVPAGEFIVTGLKGSTYYNYTISAGNHLGYGQEYSSKLLTVPSMVNSIKILSVSDHSSGFTWNPIDYINYYSVYDQNKIKIQDVNMNQYEMESLEAGENYPLYISASNHTGTGQLTPFSYRTLPESLSDDKANVKIDHIEKDSVSLSWQEIKGADGYRLLDGQNHLLYEGEHSEITISKLSSATSYKDWIVIPFNTSGIARSLKVPHFVTLPSGEFTVSDGGTTKKSVTLDIDHHLINEPIVISLEGKEVYRGQDHSYTQNELDASTPYTFVVWSENSNGDRSVPTSITLKTKKEHEVVNVDEPTLSIDDHSITEPHINQDVSLNTKQTNITSESVEFTDIDNSFSKNEITFLYNMGLIKGTALTKYEPERDITRAEFMAMIVRANNHMSSVMPKTSVTRNELTFEDINREAWYIPELTEAIRYVYVKGYSDSMFAPEEVVNREQASKMIVNAKVGDITTEVDPALFPFIDANHISKWATGSIQKGWDQKLILGYPDHSFKPKNHLNRAEAALLIYRIVVEK